MAFFRKIARHVLGIDDTETSDQELFIRDLYSGQKQIVKEISKQNISAFIETLLKKHDLLEFALILNRAVLLSSEDINKKELLKYYDFFNSIKLNLQKKVMLLEDNPWIGLFERDSFVFVTKKEIKLSDMEINAITHDVLNSKQLYARNPEIITEKLKDVC